MQIIKSTLFVPAAISAMAQVSVAAPASDDGAEFAQAVARFASRGARLANLDVNETGERGLVLDVVLQNLAGARQFSLTFDDAGVVAGSFRTRAVPQPSETRFYRGERSLLQALTRGRVISLTYECSDFFLATGEDSGVSVDPDDYHVVIRSEEGRGAGHALAEAMRTVLDHHWELAEVRVSYELRRGEARALELRGNQRSGADDRIIRVGVDTAGRVLSMDVWRSPYRPTLQRYRARHLQAWRQALDGSTEVLFVRWLPSTDRDDDLGPVSLILDRGQRVIIHPKHFGAGDLECGC